MEYLNIRKISNGYIINYNRKKTEEEKAAGTSSGPCCPGDSINVEHYVTDLDAAKEFISNL